MEKKDSYGRLKIYKFIYALFLFNIFLYFGYVTMVFADWKFSGQMMQ